ncbi:MAG: hypothetical protein QME66_05535 [Candidatus Eisenbacteria bacterium]|nr:hypothetical protein [Candidatus Eisenbacteria bacterium]
MPEKKAPQVQTAELTIADLVARGASPEEILRFARATVTSPGGRAVAKKKGHMAKLGRLSGKARRKKAAQ